jgi:Transient receptor potential (TRP) ion channel
LVSNIQNGKSTSQASVALVTVGIAGAALVVTGIASLGSLGAAGAGAAGPNTGAAHAPNFADILQWFQFVAITGMYSVNYPPVYRSFCKNFAWATGLISWGDMQRSIDSFRARTGGNLTDMSYEYLQNASLVYQASSSIQKRDINFGLGDGASLANSTKGGPSHIVSGVEAFAESLVVPSAKYIPFSIKLI